MSKTSWSPNTEDWNRYSRFLYILCKLDLCTEKDARDQIRDLMDAYPEFREEVLQKVADEMGKMKKYDGLHPYKKTP